VVVSYCSLIERVPCSNPGWGLSVQTLHVLPVYARVHCVYSSFLSLSKNVHVRLFGDSKLIVSVSMHDCLSRLSLS